MEVQDNKPVFNDVGRGEAVDSDMVNRVVAYFAP